MKTTKHSRANGRGGAGVPEPGGRAAAGADREVFGHQPTGDCQRERAGPRRQAHRGPVTPSDFTVLEDGKPQKISVFEFQQLETEPPRRRR